MEKLFRISLICVVSLALSGCGQILDSILPAHNLSKAVNPEIVCLQTIVAETGKEAAVAALLAPILAGIVVDQIVKGLEVESKQYVASYSARGSSYLLTATYKDGVEEPRKALYLETITISRYYGEKSRKLGCPENQNSQTAKETKKGIEDELVSQFTAEIKLFDDNDRITITPKNFILRRSKAKAPAFDPKLDINVQLTMTTFLEDNGVRKEADLAQVDFPIGKMPLPMELNESALAHLKSGVIILPKFSYKSLKPDQTILVAPLNITAKIMESNDFGDVIGKAAKTTSEKKGDIVKQALKLLGIKQE